jgi:hypothetical protein
VRAWPLHLLGGGGHGAAMGADAPRRRPLRRRQGPPRRPAHPVQGEIQALRRQQRDAARVLLPGQARQGRPRRHVQVRARAGPRRAALRQRLQRREHVRRQGHARGVHPADRRAAGAGGAGGRGRAAGPRQQPGGPGNPRGARQARRARPAALVHGGGRVVGERARARRRPRVGVAGGVRAPGRVGRHALGFWELFMSRDNGHLVDAEGQVNEAGRRLLKLKHEWLTHKHGSADENGEFKFRGYHGRQRRQRYAFSRCAVTSWRRRCAFSRCGGSNGSDLGRRQTSAVQPRPTAMVDGSSSLFVWLTAASFLDVWIWA